MIGSFLVTDFVWVSRWPSFAGTDLNTNKSTQRILEWTLLTVSERGVKSNALVGSSSCEEPVTQVRGSVGAR